MRNYKSATPKKRLVYEPAGSRGKWRKPEYDKKPGLRSSGRWQAIRERVLCANPICVVCGHAANEAHHVDMNEARFFDESNLVSVCEDCHVKVHSAYKRGIAPETLFPKMGDIA
jgi:5-methylcytosine-specific restriction endonuclease McrA